jgi:hypothetical protein
MSLRRRNKKGDLFWIFEVAVKVVPGMRRREMKKFIKDGIKDESGMQRAEDLVFGAFDKRGSIQVK